MCDEKKNNEKAKGHKRIDEFAQKNTQTWKNVDKALDAAKKVKKEGNNE